MPPHHARLQTLASQLSSVAASPAATNAARQRARRAKLRAVADDGADDYDDGADQPLKGLLIVEMAMVIAAPQACALMADMGARVIKVEPPGGEMWRKNGMPASGLDRRGETFTVGFESINRGKESMVLDMKEPTHMEALKRLLAKADAFVTNLRQPALESQGLDYDTLKKEFPALVYAHFTAWGRQGPKKDDPGYDVGAFWAASGLQFHARASDTDDLPRFVGGIGDYTTCRDLVMGVTAALYRREKTGKGTLVDACLLRSGMFSAQGTLNLGTLAPGYEPRPQGDYVPPEGTGTRLNHWNATYNCYKCSDGAWIQMLGLESGRHLPKFLDALGLADAGIGTAFLAHRPN